jgi:hypothetical protein
MLRILAFLVVGVVGLAFVAMGGRIGPIDLTEMPPQMIGFFAVTALVLLGLRHI